jgi:cobalt-zinc-cadmium efflux system membrane fusion protein
MNEESPQVIVDSSNVPSAQPSTTPTAAPMRRQVGWTIGILAALTAGWVGVAAYGHQHSETGASAAAAGNAESIAVSDAGRKIVHLETQTVTTAGPDDTIHTTGTVSFPEDRKEIVSPRLSGRVREVMVKVGDKVQAGQTLAIMDSVDAANAQTTAREADNRLRLAHEAYDRQKRLFALGTPDVTAAQAGLEQAQQHVTYTKEALRRVREQAQIGGFTEKPLSDAQTEVIGAQADLAQAQSDLAVAQKEQERTTRLVDIGVAAKRDLDAATNATEKAQVSVNADRDKLQLSQQTLDREKRAFKTNLYADQQVRSAESDYEQAQLQEQAADRALRLAKAQILRDVKQAEADLESAKADDENAHNALILLGHPNVDGSIAVTAPIAGSISERNVNPGQIVDQSQETPWQMFTIVDNRSVWIDADLYEKDMNRAAIGENVRVTLPSLPRYVGAGKIVYISPALDPHTHTLKVRCELPNPGGLLKEGLYVNVALQTAGHAQVSESHPVIPLTAIRHEGEVTVVYVDQGDGHYARRPVTLGATVGEDRVAVVSGLKAGEKIVTHGALFLGQDAGGD